MRLIFLACLAPILAFAQSLARTPEIDTVIIVKRPNTNGYTMQYSEAGAYNDVSPLIRVGDAVPLLSDADIKVVKPLFDKAIKDAKPKTVGTLTVSKVVGDKYVSQITAIGEEGGQPTLTRAPLHDMTSATERKQAEDLFAIAKRARTGK
jgi:hypothetical protein